MSLGAEHAPIAHEILVIKLEHDEYLLDDEDISRLICDRLRSYGYRRTDLLLTGYSLKPGAEAVERESTWGISVEMLLHKLDYHESEDTPVGYAFGDLLRGEPFTPFVSVYNPDFLEVIDAAHAQYRPLSGYTLGDAEVLRFDLSDL